MQIIEDKRRDVIKFINREAIYKRLRTVVSFLLGGKKVDFSLQLGGGSYTDGKQIVVGVPEDIVDLSYEEIYIILTALAGHESQHVLSSNFVELERYMKRLRAFFTDEEVVGQVTDKISHSVANILEDGRIENILGKKMPGMKDKIRFLRMHDWNGSMSKDVDDMSMYLNSMLFISVLGIYPKGYHDFASEEVKNEISKIKPYIIKAVEARTAKEALMIAEEIITVHSKDFLLKHIREANQNLQDFNDMMEKLVDFLKDIHKNSEETETQDSEGMSIHIVDMGDDSKSGGGGEGSSSRKEKKEDSDDEEGKGKGTEGEDTEDEDGDGGSGSKEDEDAKDEEDGAGEGEESNSSDEDKDSESSNDSNNKNKDTDSSKEAEPDENNMELSQGDADGYQESGRSEDEYNQLLDDIRKGLMAEAKEDIGRVKRDSIQQSKEVDFSLSNKEIREAIGDRTFTEIPNDFELSQSLPPEVKIRANKFKRSIADIFQNKTRINRSRQDQGVINPSDLYRVKMKQYNIFMERGRKVTSDYVAYILQDGSGSMMGEKEKFSAYALSVIEEGLRDVIPYKMTTFNTGMGGVTHHVVKNWNDRSTKNYSINFLKHRRAGGGNYDSISIAIASKELMKRPEKDKILIVLSDGLPASIENTKASIKAAREQGIHVIGLMFGEESFREQNYESYRDMYQKNIVATAPNNITNKLSKVLKEVLVR